MAESHRPKNRIFQDGCNAGETCWGSSGTERVVPTLVSCNTISLTLHIWFGGESTSPTSSHHHLGGEWLICRSTAARLWLRLGAFVLTNFTCSESTPSSNSKKRKRKHPPRDFTSVLPSSHRDPAPQAFLGDELQPNNRGDQPAHATLRLF
jgi:hypothetical protein